MHSFFKDFFPFLFLQKAKNYSLVLTNLVLYFTYIVYQRPIDKLVLKSISIVSLGALKLQLQLNKLCVHVSKTGRYIKTKTSCYI